MEEEKEELKQYQQLDRQRRALEYTIYDKELNEAVENLSSIENQRNEESSIANEVHAKSLELQDKLRKTEKQIKNLNNDISLFTKEKEMIEQENQDFIKQRTRLEFFVRDFERKLEREKFTQVIIIFNYNFINIFLKGKIK